MSNNNKIQTKVQVVSIFLYVVIGVLITIGLIFATLAYTQNSEWDLPNWITLTVEIGVGIGIATSILSYDRARQKKSEEQQDEISDMIKHIGKLEELQQKSLLLEIETKRKRKNAAKSSVISTCVALSIYIESLEKLVKAFHNKKINKKKYDAELNQILQILKITFDDLEKQKTIFSQDLDEITLWLLTHISPFLPVFLTLKYEKHVTGPIIEVRAYLESVIKGEHVEEKKSKSPI